MNLCTTSIHGAIVSFLNWVDGYWEIGNEENPMSINEQLLISTTIGWFVFWFLYAALQWLFTYKLGIWHLMGLFFVHCLLYKVLELVAGDVFIFSSWTACGWFIIGPIIGNIILTLRAALNPLKLNRRSSEVINSKKIIYALTVGQLNHVFVSGAIIPLLLGIVYVAFLYGYLMIPPFILTEGVVLGVFFLGLYVSRKLERRWHPSEIVTMYCIGLSFEVLTAYMWQYRNISLLLSFPDTSDIAILFPLGWAGLIMTATSIVEYAWRRWNIKVWWKKHLVLMATWLVVGGSREIFFYNFGMIEYINNEYTQVNFLLGQVSYLPPFMILIGYSVLQPFISYFFQWMERGLVLKPTKV